MAPAGLWSTPSDLCRFAIELQKSVAGESNKIISQEMAGKMLTPETGDWALSRISETEFVYMDGGVELTFVKGYDDRYDQIQRWGAVLSRKKG